MHHRAYGMHRSPECHVWAACIANIGLCPPRSKARHSTLISMLFAATNHHALLLLIGSKLFAALDKHVLCCH